MEYIVAGIFFISLIVRGFRWLLRQTNPPAARAVPPPSQGPPQAPVQPQNPFQSQVPSRPQPGLPPQMPRPAAAQPPAPAFPQQAYPQQAFPQQARTQPRQPSAGGPAVPVETNRQEFVRQEQGLVASEPAGLGVLLTSSAPPAAAPNALFGGTDDLVRAIILQEVLGPPLSRRKPLPPPSA
jgi:hypothetical protein